MMIGDVTIGIPAHNEERFIEAAIRAAAPQCKTLFVADNCSTDATSAICFRLAQQFSNLVYTRHATNIGALNNFKHLMDAAKTSYFMWLGAHDTIAHDYVPRLRDLLERDPSASLAFSPVAHRTAEGIAIRRYDYPYRRVLLSRDPATRFLGLLRYLDDCSLFHGLYRLEHIRHAWENSSVIGFDHVVLGRVSVGGRFVYCPATHYCRTDIHGSDSQTAQFHRIRGKDDRVVAQTYAAMQIRLIVACQEARSIFPSWRLRMVATRARFWLAVRYGVFGPAMHERIFDKASVYLHRSFRKAFRRR